MTDRPPLAVNPEKRFKLEHRLRVWLGNDLSTPRGRRRAFWAMQLLDHAFLRTFWHNFHEVAPGVYRANQPDARRLAAFRAMGIEDVVSLRGHSVTAVRAFQIEACETLGLRLHTARLSARKLKPAENYLELLDLFETVRRPFVFHCKSGADRTGLAAAFYLIHCEGRSVDEVRDQLSWRYLHSRRTSTGVLDHMLNAYARTGEAADMDLRRWLAEVYDPAALTAEFRATPWWRRGRR